MSGDYILIVDDERSIREMIGFGLRRKGFDVGEAADAPSVHLKIAERRPDVLLVDWMMPAIGGLDLVRQLRSSPSTSGLAMIMLTARVDEADRILALDCGVDDYVTKPFSQPELVARINAVLRRSRPASSRISVRNGGLLLDSTNHCLKAGGRTVSLAPMDCRLLDYFMEQPDRVHTRVQLLNEVWAGSAHDERTVDVQIRRLRVILSDLQLERAIQTVYGAGYRFSLQLD